MRTKTATKEPLHYGVKKSVKGSNKSLFRILQESTIYNNEFTSLTSGVKVVMLAIGHYATDNRNLIHLGGDTIKAVAEETGYTVPSVRNAITALNKCGIIEPTGLKGEYIINPMFALKGDYRAVWKFYQAIESQRRILMGHSGVPVHPIISAYTEATKGLLNH